MTLSYNPPSVVNAANPPQTKQPKQISIALPGTDCLIKSQVPLAGLTSYRVGGPAEWYITPRSIEDLQAGLEWANSQNLPITLLGAGSNLLVSDHGILGLVISTRYLRQTKFDPETGQVTASAGEPIARLAWQAAERGWQGMEWAVGIPGTVGGAIVMNAGAHKFCIADILVKTQVLSPKNFTNSFEDLSVQDLGYSYRTSILQGDPRLVTQATFQLRPGADPAEVIAATEKDLEQRRNTQPYNLPSCGSVFRNPLPHHAAWLIEQTGLKGYQIGGAQVAERHANFIVNCGGATANDIFELMRHIQQQVEEHWSIYLKPEVRFLGKF
jgi:UDP-N-acetylmuramate dehydrogenase